MRFVSTTSLPRPRFTVSIFQTIFSEALPPSPESTFRCPSPCLLRRCEAVSGERPFILRSLPYSRLFQFYCPPPLWPFELQGFT